MNNPYFKEQAQEIIRQIGSITLGAVGARQFSLCNVNGHDTLQFRITIHRNVVHYIQIRIVNDLYDLRLLKSTKHGIRPTHTADQVYCDAISEVVYRLGTPIGQGPSWFQDVGIVDLSTVKRSDNIEAVNILAGAVQAGYCAPQDPAHHLAERYGYCANI